MYLMLRFSLSGEFRDKEFNWLDNSKWFNVKLLVDPTSGDFQTPVTNKSYAQAIKEVFKSLGIPQGHLIHIGRVLGTKMLEMMEEESREIQRLGNWDPSMQDACYSTKLPMRPIRKLAGFATGQGIHYNKRTVVEPPEELLRRSPIHEWVSAGLKKVSAANLDRNARRYTAQNFLEFMGLMNRVFFQDMAALVVTNKARTLRHPIFEQLECLSCDEFEVRGFVVVVVDVILQLANWKCLTLVHYCLYYRCSQRRCDLC